MWLKNLFFIIFNMINFSLNKFRALFGISTVGARALIINEENKILLVKHTYRKYWYIPGGGVKAGETVLQALARELKEEVGLTIQEEPKMLGVYFNRFQGANDYPVVYIITKFTLQNTYSFEIEQTQWFPLKNLPLDISPGTLRRVKEYLGENKKMEQW